ncbi:MAG: histidinol-phosphate transaminase [Spirochaetota bacterium]
MSFDPESVMNRGLLDIQPYVGGKTIDDALREHGVRDAVKMSSNENALGVSPRAVAAATDAAARANQYPDAASRALRERIAGMFSVDPGCVIVGNGADEVIYYLAMCLVNDGDPVVIPRITFPIYEIAFRAMRAEMVHSGMRGLEIDLDDLLARVTPATACVALCNPNNPTGHALPPEEVRRFVEAVPDRVPILMDEAYLDFAPPGCSPDSPALFREGRRNLFIVRTFSKAYGLAGFRVGYGIGDQRLVALMNRIKLPFNVSLVSQHAALAALEDEEFFRKTIEVTALGREYLYREMRRLGLSYVESATNFVLIDTGRDADRVCDELLRRGVIVRSASKYGAPTSVRVTVGMAEHNQRFVQALEEVLATDQT